MTIAEFGELLKKYSSVAVVSHMRPDGDTIGSALALSLGLEQLGIRTEVLCESDLPESFSFFPEAKRYKKQAQDRPQAIVCVDCADEARTGQLFDWLVKQKCPKFNIDHHISNTRYATYNVVEVCSANCENIALLLESMGVALNDRIANLLMLGILTDSGTFSHSDVNARTLSIAAKLVEAGADINEISYQMFRRQKMARFRLNARVMGKARFLLDGAFAVIVVTQQDLKDCGAKQEYTEGFVDYPLTVESVEVSAALLEVRQGQYKVSLRSKGRVNVNAVASVYGGGGHILASGCMLFGELEDVVDRLRYTVQQNL